LPPDICAFGESFVIVWGTSQSTCASRSCNYHPLLSTSLRSALAAAERLVAAAVSEQVLV
jgi:hypothetical protein